MYTATLVLRISSGCEITPSHIRKLLSRPLLLRMPIQAYTRIRMAVQVGIMISSMSTVWVSLRALAMA
ncbi:hypothetical protein D3C80_1751160 [compost metagenome]